MGPAVSKLLGPDSYDHYYLKIDARQLRVQDALTLESRSRAIPVPKAKPFPNKPGAKMAAKPKAKAKAAPNSPDEELPAGAGRRAVKKK